jgi:Tol biopolymer transport system component
MPTAPASTNCCSPLVLTITLRISYDSKWIVFTSERSGYGQADLYRVHPDGTGLEQLTDDPALDDQGVLSPDGTRVAFVSTRATYRTNIWILDLNTKRFRNLTGQPGIQGDPMRPDGFFRPAWSPDGKWIAFTSDRNTEWKGHGNGSGWEHVQELSVYIVHPDGTGLRRITGNLLGLAEMVCRLQSDCLLRDSCREHMGCSSLWTFCQSYFSNRIY